MSENKYILRPGCDVGHHDVLILAAPADAGALDEYFRRRGHGRRKTRLGPHLPLVLLSGGSEEEFYCSDNY